MWLCLWAQKPLDLLSWNIYITYYYICLQQYTSFWLIPPRVTISEWYHFSHLFILTCLMRHLYSKCQTLASNHLFSPFPLLSFISLSKTQPFNPACLYGHIQSWVSWKSTPSPLQIHANHITASKSSRASSETELCTCENWRTERGRCVCRGVMYTPPLLSYPRLCLCHGSLQKISLVLLSWFNLAQFGNVKQARDSEGKKSHRHFRKIKYCVCDPWG